MPNREMMLYGIEELELTVRAYNFCKRNGVHTIGQFLALTVEDVNTWRTHSGGTLGLRAFKEMCEVQESAFYWLFS